MTDIMNSRSVYKLLQNQQEMMAMVLEGQGKITGEQKTKMIENLPQLPEKDLFKHHVDDLHNVAELPFNEDSFFFDCNLERPICNLTISPMATFLALLPVRPTTALDVKYGFLTEYDTSTTGTLPDEPCDEPRVVNMDSNFCKMRFPLGRNDLKTKTMELDRLIATACQNAFDDFFFVGNIRGASLIPRRAFNPRSRADRNLIVRGAVMKQMQTLTREHQRWLIDKLWSGDPVNNTANGGYREPIGLLNLINPSFNTDPTLTPYLESQSGDLADCDAMNSDCKDFYECIGDAANNPTLYALMEELEEVVWQRAFMAGMLPARWVWLMSPVHWSQLIKFLPCQMMADGCTNLGPNADAVSATINIDTFNMQMRQEMRTNMSITLNGRRYPVILDHSLPYNQTGNEYQSNMYFIPMSLAGQETIWLEHMDYRRISQVLRPLPGSVGNMLGWTDGGRYHHYIDFLHRCFQVASKIEPRVIFKGSRFAGCINGASSCTIQPRENYWDPQGPIDPGPA